jgi:Na+-transporting methylmalonyl-CoA/oxaloacetate decarboxylase gamma subunit
MFSTVALLSGGFSIEGIKSMALWGQGLFVVIAGLVGVFLVLTLFFFTIVIMQKIAEAAKRGKKQEDSEEA